jgi:serine phosphatase RsbU (regulator of sigma subunit)
MKNRAAHSSDIGIVRVPQKGETACGDAYLIVRGTARSLYMMVDGLGHGIGAQEAADEAVAVTIRNSDERPSEILIRVHDALKKTRGAAMSIAVVDHGSKIITYAGVGNISAALTVGTVARSMVSQNGTLGAVLPRVQEFTYAYNPNSMLLMFSDGLTSKCGLNGYPGLQSRHPQLIAGVLYRDFTRRRDDATVMVARLGADHA